MTHEDVRGALEPVFRVLLKEPLEVALWEQYGLALADVNPGDLDDAVVEIRKSHAFHTAPLPAEILGHVNEAKRKRIAAQLPIDKTYKADPSEGEWKTFTLPGIGSMRVHVLPDDHPALKRYACLTCKDTGWQDVPHEPETQSTVRRCECWKNNPVLQRQREQNARYVKERGDR